MKQEIEPYKFPTLPFHPDDKIFHFFDWEGNPTGEKYSQNDELKFYSHMCGVNDELLGPA